MTDSQQSQFRLLHWWWGLVATVVVAIGFVGLSVWLPWHREQQVIQKIEGWGGHASTMAVGPVWLRQLVGEHRMKRLQIFERVERVDLEGSTIIDAEIAHLSQLTNLRYLDLGETAVTDAGLFHLRGLMKLETLSLCSTSITDAGLRYLSESMSLKQVLLEYDSVDAVYAKQPERASTRVNDYHRDRKR